MNWYDDKGLKVGSDTLSGSTYSLKLTTVSSKQNLTSLFYAPASNKINFIGGTVGYEVKATTAVTGIKGVVTDTATTGILKAPNGNGIQVPAGTISLDEVVAQINSSAQNACITDNGNKIIWNEQVLVAAK